MKLKKIIASILAICMVLSTTSFPVYAEEATAVATVDGVEYTDIQTAITAAAPNKTVEVLSDIVVDEWKMFWQGDRTFKEIIYIDMDGLTINGNGHTLTVNNIVSATNGDQLFKQAKKLNITNWEIVQPEKKGGISLTSGTIDGVTFHGGNGVFPGDGEIVIDDCTFNTDHYCIYSEEENNGLKVTNSTFDGGDENNVIFLRGNTEFTGNTIVSGAKVRVVSGSPVVSGNDFGDVIVKVYNNATATIEDNTINNIEIDEPTAEVNSTFGENILSEEAETTLKEVGVIEDTSVETVVAQVGDTTYTTLSEAIDAAQYGDTVTLLSDLTIESDLNSAAEGYFNIAEEDKITLDFGGKTINLTDNSTGNFILFYNYGDLTIKNGTVNLTATNNREWNAESAIVLNRGGNLTIESGTYTHNGGTDMAFVVDNSGNYYGDAITDIEGGTLTSAYIAIRNRMEQNSHGASGKATLNISGGTITGTKRAVWAQAASTSATSPATGAINVTGGEVGLIDTARSSGAECMTTISGGTVAEFKGEAGELTVTENGTITGTVTILTASGEEVDYVVDENGVYVEAPEVNYVVKIGETGYATLVEALTVACAMTGDVTVEIYDKVTLNQSLSGSYDSITFVGKDTDAEIYLDVQGYITATGKKVAFEELTLSKAEGGFITNAGFMNVAFGVYDVTEVTYSNCTFANGAYASSGDVTFTGCTFYRSHDKYGLWAYGDVDVTVDSCTFADYRGIKMYAEGAAKTTNLTVKNSDFSAVNNKPAIVLTYGESVTLEGNTYSSTGVFELDLDGAPNGTSVTSTDEITCVNDNGACGVLVDGKIYTTVAQAAEVAVAGSTVTLLHNSLETVEFAEGVILDKNGYDAAGVTVKVSLVTVNAYVAQDTHVNGWTTVWGQLAITGTESFYIEIYSGDTYLGKTTLIDTDKVLLDGASHEVTWHAFLDGSDSWWNTEWTVAPVSNLAPTEVKYYVDGEQIGSGVVKMSSADDLNPVVWEELRGVTTLVTGLEGEGTEENPYLINNLAELKWFRDDVNGGNKYTGKYIKLTADIDLNNEEWDPIGTEANTFQGHFDGGDKTISNLCITGYNNYVGLFGRTNNSGSIKNLTLNNVQVSGRLYVGALVGTPSTFAYSNIKLTGHVEVNGMSYVGGVGGKNAYGNWTNITVDVDDTSYVKATSTENGKSYRTYVGGVIGFNGEGGHTFKNITSNIDVIGDVCDIGGIFGIAHYGNNFENITCTGDVTNNNNTADRATDVLETGLIAGVWHNQVGTEVEFTNINATGTITATYVPDAEFLNGGLIGNAYNASNETADTSGSLIIDGKEVWLKVAKIGDTGYASLADAVAAVKAGETITMLSDATLSENVTLPAGITFNGNGKTITGNIVAGGDLTFEGYTKVATFNAGYNKPTITIGEGATLETTSGRMVIGHGATFNITGSITDAKTADTASITPSLIAPGASFTGAGVNFNVTNAYVKFTYYCSTKASQANDTFNFNVSNSIWDQTNKIECSVPTGTMDPTFNFKLKDSVLNSTSHLVFAATKGEIVFDNSNVNVGVYRQLENRSNLTIKNGSVVYASVQVSSNAKNPGTTTVDNATYVTTGTFGGADVGTGTLILQNEARFTTGTLAKVNVTVDGTSLLTATKADTTTTTVTVDGSALEVGDEVKVIDLNGSASIEGIVTVQGKGVEATYGDDGDVTITKQAVPVASVTDAEGNVTNYTDLQTALKALTAGVTLTLLDDVTITEAWDCRYNGAKITVPVTIDGNEHTLKLTGSVNDKNWNTVFRFEADATVKNLIIDASEATGIQRGISAKYNITVDNCTLIGNDASAKRAVIFGEGAGAELSNVTATITNTEFINWSYGVSDNQSGKDANSVSITDSTFNNASVLVSAAETVTFTGNTVKDGYVNITSYTAADTVIVTATGNTLEGTDDEIMVNPENITADDAFITPVAKIGSKYYETLEKAVSKAANGDTITLISDVVLSETITIPESANITLDLNGKNVTYNSTVQGEAMITNKGTLVINDSVGTGVINYNYTGTADSSYGKGNYTISNGGTLTVNGGKITIANLRAHAKYPIDNNSTTGDAILVINGGHLYNYNTSAIRQFCNSTTYQNSVTINGGLIEGYSAIWVQNPGSKTVNGTLSITGGEIRTTAAAYVNGTAALKDVASRLYCTIDGNGGAWSETSAVSITGGTMNENVYLAEEAPAAITIDIENATFNGRLEIPAPELPTATVTKLENEELTFALNFVADEATPEQLMYYGNWYADFVLTVNKDVTFNANGGADGFLSGQYDAWSENWVNVPFEDVTLEAGESLRIMEYAAKLLGQPGLKFTYKDVYDFVKNFDCGVFFEDEFLAENPDLEVTLELRIYNSADESESYAIGETYAFEFEGVAYNTVTKVIYEDVSDALLAAKANETVILLADAEESMVLVTPGVTLDLNGYSLTSGYVSSFGNIVDTADSKGTLEVAADCIHIYKGNEYLPVKNEGGYEFYKVTEIKQDLLADGTYAFLPYFEEALNKKLLNGQETTGVTINVRLSWLNDQGVGSQYFVYNDTIVNNVVGSYKSENKDYGRAFTLTVTGTEGLKELCYEVVIVSAAGVEIASEKLQVQTTVNE